MQPLKTIYALLANPTEKGWKPSHPFYILAVGGGRKRDKMFIKIK